MAPPPLATAPFLRFGGVYRVNSVMWDDKTLNMNELPPKAPLENTLEASFEDNPQLVDWRQLFLTLQRLGNTGQSKGRYAWVDDPASRVYSPEDLDGPYLYSRCHYWVVDDEAGADFTQYMQAVEGPSLLARQADLQAIRQGRLQKAPPGYGTRQRLSQAYLNDIATRSIPVSMTLSFNGGSVTVTPEAEKGGAFRLEA